MVESDKFVEYILENIQRDLELLLQYEVLTTTDYDKITSLLNNQQQQQPKQVQGQGLTETLTNSIGNSLIENRLKSFTTNNNQTKPQTQTNLTKELTGLTKKLSSIDKTQLNSAKTTEGETKDNPNTREPVSELEKKLNQTARNQLPGLKNVVKGAAIKHTMEQWDNNNSGAPPPLPPKKPNSQPDLPSRPSTNSLNQPDLPKKPTSTTTTHPSLPKKPSFTTSPISPTSPTTTTPSLLRNKFQTMANSFEPSAQDPTPTAPNLTRNKFATTSVRLPATTSSTASPPTLPIKPRRSATSVRDSPFHQPQPSSTTSDATPAPPLPPRRS